MGYQIDIDVNSEQLEFIQETLNSTFSSFRTTIEKLDATLNKNAKLKDTISKNDPNYVSAKSTVAAEVPILKEFESSGSVKFLDDTLKSVSNSLTGLAKRAEAAGEKLNIDDSFISNIKKLSDFFANMKDESTGQIGRQSVGNSPANLYGYQNKVNFEGSKATTLSRNLESTISTRLNVLETYKNQAVQNPQLINRGIKQFEQELISLVSIAKTYGQTQNHALLQTALIRSEAENAVNHLRAAGGKNIRLPNSYDNANDNLSRYLRDRITPVNDTRPSTATSPPGAPAAKPKSPEPSTGVDKVISDFSKLLAQVKVATTLISTDANKANQNRAAAIIKLVDTTSERINGGESVLKLSGKFFTELRDRLGKLETYSAKEGKSIAEPIDKIRSAITQFTTGVGEKQQVSKDTPKEVSKKQPEPVAQKVDSADTATAVSDSGKKLAASIRSVIVDLEAVNAPDYKGSQEEINRLVKSIIHLREVTDTPVVKQTGVESYDLVSGFAQFEAYKRAQQIDKTLPDRIGAVVAGDEYVGFNEKVRKLEAENPVNVPELDNSKIKKGNDSIQQVIVDIDAINIPEAAEHLKSAIESLARDIIKYGGLLSRPVLSRTGIESYQSVGNPLQLQAYKRALELDKTLPDRINVVTVPGNKIGSAQQQFLITNASSFTQADGNKPTSTPEPEGDNGSEAEAKKQKQAEIKAESERKKAEAKKKRDARAKREKDAQREAENRRKAEEFRQKWSNFNDESDEDEEDDDDDYLIRDVLKFLHDPETPAKIADLSSAAKERGFYGKQKEQASEIADVPYTKESLDLLKAGRKPRLLKAANDGDKISQPLIKSIEAAKSLPALPPGARGGALGGVSSIGDLSTISTELLPPKAQAVKSPSLREPEVLDAEVIPETAKELYEQVKAKNDKKHQENVKQIDKELEDLLKRNEDLRQKRKEYADRFAKAAEDARKAAEDMYREYEKYQRARAEAQSRYREQEESRRSSSGYSKDTEKFVNDSEFDAKIQDLIQVATERGAYKNTEFRLPDYQREIGVDEAQKSLNGTQLLLPAGGELSIANEQRRAKALKYDEGFYANTQELTPSTPDISEEEKAKQEYENDLREAKRFYQEKAKKAHEKKKAEKILDKERERSEGFSRDSQKFLRNPKTPDDLIDLISAVKERGFYKNEEPKPNQESIYTKESLDLIASVQAQAIEPNKLTLPPGKPTPGGDLSIAQRQLESAALIAELLPDVPKPPAPQNPRTVPEILEAEIIDSDTQKKAKELAEGMKRAAKERQRQAEEAKKKFEETQREQKRAKRDTKKFINDPGTAAKLDDLLSAATERGFYGEPPAENVPYSAESLRLLDSLKFPPAPSSFNPKLPPVPSSFNPKPPPVPSSFNPKVPPVPSSFNPKVPPVPSSFNPKSSPEEENEKARLKAEQEAKDRRKREEESRRKSEEESRRRSEKREKTKNNDYSRDTRKFINDPTTGDKLDDLITAAAERGFGTIPSKPPEVDVPYSPSSLKLLSSQKFPPVPSSFNPKFPPVPSSFNPNGSFQTWFDKAKSAVSLLFPENPKLNTSNFRFNKLISASETALEGIFNRYVNPVSGQKKVVNGVSPDTSSGGSTPPPPRKPPAPPATPEPPEEGSGKVKSDSQIFREARDRQTILKDSLLQGGIGNIGTRRANYDDLFSGNDPKNKGKADALVNATNRWIEKQIATFDTAKLADAKVRAKLGDKAPLENLFSTNEFTQRKIELAQLQARRGVTKEEKAEYGAAKREESSDFTSYRRGLEAKLKAALSDTTENQADLLQAVAAEARRKRDFYSNDANSYLFLDKKKFGKDGEAVNSLQSIENRATKKISAVQENRVETSSFQELRAAGASIRTFLQDLQTFTTGLVQVSSAMNKEVIKLGVANNNSISKTDKDIADSTALAKKFGGSVSTYLKDLANIKIADLSQIAPSGDLTSNRFLDSEVKSLVSGLRASYNVNQLDAEAQDGASKAVAQILSKGKVQAEELRGQLGDRLNGAVTLFAQALGISTAQLDRRLKEGSILDVELFKFGRLLDNKYSEAAQSPTLIKETTGLSGSTKDILTQATQPIAGVATVGAQFVNTLTDGVKANAATISVAALPIGLALVSGISGGVKDAFVKSSFTSPIITGLGEALRSNAKILSVIGGGVAAATAGSLILGTDGLDKTILKLGDQIKALSGIIGNLFAGAGQGIKDTKIGQSGLAKFAFEALPLAALAAPVTNFAIDKGREIAENIREKNKAIPVAAGSKPSLGAQALSAVSALPFLNVAAAIGAGVLAYSVANTRFISEYADVTDKLVKELRKSKKDSDSDEQKKQNFRKNEGTDNPLSIDSLITSATDTINVLRGNFKDVSLARLTEARKGAKDGSKGAAEIDAAIKEKVDKGYVPGNTFAGNAATTQIAKEEAAKKTLIDQVKERLNPSYYQEDVNKAAPIVALYRAESKKLLDLQNDGVTKRPEIDAQNVRVQTLAVQAREAMPDLINAQQDVTSRIAKLEELKQGILAQDLVGAKDRAASIDAELSQLKAALPQFIQFVQSFSDPNQRISDRKIEISSREKKISLERLRESANVTSERNTSVATRSSEKNDDQLNLREAGFGVKTAEQGISKLQELLTLATEKKDLISQQTSSDTQQAEYEAALKAEAEALNALNEGTLNLTKARLDEAKAMEEFLLVNYSRSIRQFSSQDSNTDAYEVKAGVLKGDLQSTIAFGTVTKAQFALNEYLKILPQLNLNADDVKEKLKELSDQVALSTLAFIEQQTSLSNAKTIAKLDSVVPTSPFRDTFFDRFDTLKRGYQKAQVEQDTTTYLTQETKKAFNNTQDPTERGNLAIKLIGLETDAIRRKHEVEMAGIELARSSYRRNMEVLATLLTRQSDTAQSSSANRSFVEGRKLEDRVAQTNEFGAALTENRQSLERLNTALTIQSQNRGVNNTAKAESEKLFSDQFPEIPDQYKRDLSKRLTDSTQFQVNDDIKNLQSGIELATNSQDPNAPVVSKNLGTIDVKIAEALVKLLTTIAQLKQIDQSDSVAVAQARNAFNLSTGAVVRGRRQQESNNRLSSLETKAAGDDNVGQLKVAETNAQNTINSLQAKLRGTSLTLASVFTPAEVDYNEQIRKATAGIKQAEAARAALKKTQDETANGATQVELDANAAILKGEDEKIKRLRVQLRSTQIAGADKLGTAIAAFNLDLGNLIETISSKLRESIDLLNQTASVFRAQGLDNLREPAIYDVIPQSYTDKNGVVKVRDSQSKVNYDPSVSGNYETAQLLTQINKIDAEAKTKVDLLAYAQKNIAQIRNEGGVENTQQYKDVPELRTKLKDIESLILKAKDLDEATANLDLAMGNLVASIFTDAEKAAVIDAKLKRDRNNDIIAQADLTSTLSQNAERRLNLSPGNSDVLRLLKGKEPLIDDLQAQRRKAKAEYEISQLSPLQTEREKGKLLYEDKTADITDQLSKLPAYGNRFALAVEDAVANGSKLSSVLSDAIQKGDWSNVLSDTLANIANALGDKFLNDASKGLGGLIGGGVQALFGIGSNSSGTMPSYSMGMLPSYAGGNLPGGVQGRKGSAYPRTRSQDTREPNTSHLAIINSSELVVPSSEVSEYVDFKRGITASSNINTSNTSNDSSSATYNSFNYSNYQSGKNDTFARPEVYRKQEEDSRMRRFT
jgi:tape measure domain-containing protein